MGRYRLQGEPRRLVAAREPDGIELSPNGSRLALYDLGRLRVVDTATGSERSIKSRYGVLEWLDSERFLYRSGGAAIVYGPRLERLRRYRYVRLYHQALAANRIFGTDRYRLRSLNLDTGRKRGVAQLTDRGVIDLVGVPGRPRIEPGRRRPPSPLSARGPRASSACRR